MSGPLLQTGEDARRFAVNRTRFLGHFLTLTIIPRCSLSPPRSPHAACSGRLVRSITRRYAGG
jgi:hypothetical protein